MRLKSFQFNQEMIFFLLIKFLGIVKGTWETVYQTEYGENKKENILHSPSFSLTTAQWLGKFLIS